MTLMFFYWKKVLAAGLSEMRNAHMTLKIAFSITKV